MAPTNHTTMPTNPQRPNGKKKFGATDDDAFHSAFQHLMQERRFFRMHCPDLATTVDSATLDHQLEQHQQQIQRDSLVRNELGLYRNASLVLACLCIVHDELETALEHMLDVAFLDLAGSTNSLPGHRSFDGRLSLMVPFVAGIIRDLLRTLELTADSIERDFKTRWLQFSSFGSPPFTPDESWHTLQVAVRAGANR